MFASSLSAQSVDRIRTVALSIGVATTLAASAMPQMTTRVSVDSANVEGMGPSRLGALSGNGQLVAFNSLAPNLVAGDSNGVQDVFVHDTLSGATTRVSVGPLNAEADMECVDAQISANGRFVVFTSAATTLTPPDPMHIDVFARDRQMNTTIRVSVPMGVGQPNGPSGGGSLSADGGLVVFQSVASNLVAVDPNGHEDVFVRNLGMHSTQLASIGMAGAPSDGNSNSASISGGGRYVAFWSDATNLVAGDTNGVSDIFVRDLMLNQTTRVSIGTGSPGAQSDGHCQPYTAISGDGRYVVFGSVATNLVLGDSNGATDVFVRDRQLATTTRVSVDSSGLESNGGSTAGPISSAGRFVAFSSVADNLVPVDANGKEDVFVHDLITGWTSLESVSTTGTQANDATSVHGISADGWRVTFSGPPNNLVPGDINLTDDVFLRDRACPPPIYYCTAGTTSNGCAAVLGVSGTPSVSASSGFTIVASSVEGQKSGLIFYGISGQNDARWGIGGTSFLCIKSPSQRTPVQNSGGTFNSCDGQLSSDFLAFIAGNPSALGQPLSVGEVFNAQAWFRDPPAVKSTSLSDAVQWVMCP